MLHAPSSQGLYPRVERARTSRYRWTSTWALSLAVALVGTGTPVGAPARAQSVVDILPVPSNGAWGLEYIDGFLYVGDDSDGFVFKVDPADGSVLETIPTPYDVNHISFGANHGVTWDGGSLWVAGDFNKDWLYRLDLDGTVLDSIPSPTDAVGGLSWDGSALLVTTYFPNGGAGVLVTDPTNGNVLGPTIPTQGTQPFGIAFDPGTNTFWNGMDDNDGDPEDVWHLDYPSGAVNGSFPTPGPSPKGIALGGGHLWVVANANGMSGRRIYKIDLAGAGTPDAVYDPTTHDFGIVAIGDTAQRSQTVRNDGDGDLTISSITSAAPFGDDAPVTPIVLAPGAMVTFNVTFTPQVTGDVNDVITIVTDEIGQSPFDVQVAGIGVLQQPTVAVTPTNLGFADTGVGLVRAIEVIVENEGFQDLTVTGISSDASVFEVAGANLPAVLSTFQTLRAQVIFRPTTEGSEAGTVTVSSTDPSSPTVDLPATGDGVTKTHGPGEVIWSAAGIENVVSVMEIPDITGDGRPDAVMETYDAGADGDPLRGMHGNSDGGGVVAWAVGDGESGGWGDQCLAHDDVDGDGKTEVLRGVAWGGQRIDVRNVEDGTLVWQYDTTADGGGGWVYAVASLPDVSGDGLPEVLAAVGTDSGAGTGPRRIYCFEGDTGVERFSFIGPDAFQSVAAIEDVNDDDVPDVIAGAGGNGADDRVYCIDGSSVGAASAIWDFPTGATVYSVAVIPDVDGDLIDDVLAGSWSNIVYCLSGVDGSEIWSTGVGADIVRVESLADVTDDGVADVVVAPLTTSFRLLNGATGATEWTKVTGGNVWSATSLPDVSGDGRRDIIAGSQDDNVYCVSGEDGSELWTTDLGALVFSVRAIGDVNASGFADVIAGTQFLNGEGGEMFCLEGSGIVVSAGEPGASPGVPRFVGIHPNPLRGAGVFRVDGATGPVRVQIFSATGRLVRELRQVLHTGTDGVRWDGRTIGGVRTPPGVYFYRVLLERRPDRSGFAANGKLTVLR